MAVTDGTADVIIPSLSAGNHTVEIAYSGDDKYNSASKTDSAISEKQEEAAAETQTDLLELAQKAYNEKRYEDALKLVKDFFAEATSRIDEGLYLEGQILEADSAVQDIKQSIGAYDTVVNNWPQSRLWKKARERSIYLKRFYIDIR